MFAALVVAVHMPLFTVGDECGWWRVRDIPTPQTPEFIDAAPSLRAVPEHGTVDMNLGLTNYLSAASWDRVKELASGIDGTWNLALELMASNPNFRETGAQNAVYQAVVDEWGSPLRRLGVYSESPVVVGPEIVNGIWDLGAAATAYRNLGARTVIYPRTPERSDVIQVTPQGVALPAAGKYKIPDSYIDNPYRPGSYGERVNGRFIERLRIDPPTPPGKNGPSYSHYHLNGGHEHLSPRNRNDPGFLR